MKEKNSIPRTHVYEQITERIVALLEKGTVPWRKPWKAQSGLPRNFVTKKPYRGINVLLLHAMNYESPDWLTFRQAVERGGSVRKGEKACPVVFWKRLDVENKLTGEKEKIPLLRFYHVFNIAQCEGLKSISTDTDPTPPNAPTQPEQILFHELIHSTGHPSRLNRPTLTESEGFGSNPYCKEELIAEMGAAFLCGHAGLAETTLENSASYIQNWLEALQNDKKLIVQAAAQAQRAADFILGIKHEDEPQPIITAVKPGQE